MAGRWVKMLFFTLIILFSLVLNGCLVPSYNAAFHTKGSTWKSSNPDIWFTVNEDGTNSGELNFNGKMQKIQIGSIGGYEDIFAVEAGGNEEIERIMHDHGRLMRTSIQSCSKMKLVLKVTNNYLPDLN